MAKPWNEILAVCRKMRAFFFWNILFALLRIFAVSFWRMTVQRPVVNPENHRQHGIINKTVVVATRVLCRSLVFFILNSCSFLTSYQKSLLLKTVTQIVFIVFIVLLLMLFYKFIWLVCKRTIFNGKWREKKLATIIHSVWYLFFL